MVFPIGDDNSDRRLTPWVTFVLIILNVLVFFTFQAGGTNDKFTYAFSTVPREIATGQDIVTEPQEMVDPRTGQRYLLPGLEPTPGSVYLTLLTSIFMHGSIAHLLGNMWFLWIFGDNVEDDLGHGRYLTFYLLSGLAASLAHVGVSLGGANAMIPSLGASGAISGVMGGYLVLHPQRRVRVILMRMVTEVPAFVAVGIWFLFQIVSSLAEWGGEGGGVAYAAHIGGFIAGALLVKLFSRGRQIPDERHLHDLWHPRR